jgi:hypothetical protein
MKSDDADILLESTNIVLRLIKKPYFCSVNPEKSAGSGAVRVQIPK